MKTELKDVSPTQKEIHVEVPAEDFKEAYTKVSQKYAKAANVPGFRKGYAPLDVVRLRYKEEIKNEVLQLVVPDKVAQAVQEHELQPLAEPHLHVEDLENVKVNGSQAVGIHVHVEVMPEIPRPETDKIEVTRRVKPVEDSEVEDLITSRLEQEASLNPVERPSEMGDTVVADLEGTFDGEPDAEPIRAEDLEIKLGDEVIESAFTDNLLGVSQDEEKSFTVSYPAEFSSPALAGKTVHYKAKIKAVGKRETPAMDDEWARSLDEGYESLDDLRKKLRSDLESYARSDADARVRNEAIAKLIENNQFEVPSTLIESQARNLLNNFAQDLQQRGVDLNTVQNDFVEMAFSQMRSQAERDVRGAMLLEKVAEAEKIEIKPEEVEEEISKMAEYYRTTPEEVKSSLEKQGGTRTIENNLRTRKAIEALIANAKVVEGEWIDPNASEAIVQTDKPKKAAKGSAGAEEKPAKSAKKKTAKSKAQ